MGGLLVLLVGASVFGVGVLLFTPRARGRFLAAKNPVWDTLRGFGMNVDQNEKIERWFATYFVPPFLIVVGLMIILAGVSMV
jgi:hypothetical protein